MRYRSINSSRTNSSADRRASAGVNGSTTTNIGPLSTSASSFSTPGVRSSGAASGFTTSSGCELNVRSSAGNPTDDARAVNCPRMARCPMCTPSKAPTVTTEPCSSCGSASASRITKHDSRLKHAVPCLGYCHERIGLVQEGDAASFRTTVHRIAVQDPPKIIASEPLDGQRWNRHLQWLQLHGTVAKVIDCDGGAH